MTEHEFRQLHRQHGHDEVLDEDINHWIFPDTARLTDSDYPQAFEPAAEGTHEFLKLRKRYLELRIEMEANRSNSCYDVTQLKSMAASIRKHKEQLDQVTGQLAATPEAQRARQQAEFQQELARQAKDVQREIEGIHCEIASLVH